ncbi:ankyrin repeat and IBR domain-containing protein 1 [Lates japonicus]|uniref:Ankyrin repeat and IBR domain-containing protein 1 n=1 Tax=Lates japonicus TaxID=270547 RepID=A0AAD3RBK2_LATJO|nr:ankyrin repeat and IBR domain-containing protein 1 [Lates japonicus]
MLEVGEDKDPLMSSPGLWGLCARAVGQVAATQPTGLFSSSSDWETRLHAAARPILILWVGCKCPSLLGSIMAWFHDADPQGSITYGSVQPPPTRFKPGALHAGGAGPMPLPYAAALGRGDHARAWRLKVCHVASQCDSVSDQLRYSSSEWEEQVHLV